MYGLVLEGLFPDDLGIRPDHELDVQSWSWSESLSGSFSYGAGGGASKTSMQDLQMTLGVDESCPLLFQACASGRVFSQAILTCSSAGGPGLGSLRLELTEVLITSFQIGGPAGQNGDLVQLALNFGKLNFVYSRDGQVFGASSKIEAGWDQKRNRPY